MKNMSMTGNHSIKDSTWKRLLLFVVMLHVQCSLFHAFAQITIGGNVYGGGNRGNLEGSTSVVIHEADIHGKVFGGACQANVDKGTFVHVDGEHASGDIIINAVYGGNDVSGFIGPAEAVPDGFAHAPSGASINSYVLTTPERTAANGEHQPQIFIGKVFGGGYGDYTYDQSADGSYRVTLGDSVISTSAPNLPELDNAYLELRGGTIAHVYGGGDAVTVKENTTICVDNSSKVTTSIERDGKELLTDERITEMRLNTVFTQVSSDHFQFARVFGGNNKAAMDIIPKWNLLSGRIRDLYGGGNEGDMIGSDGVLIDIPATSAIEVDNVFGGCRRADVCPGGNKNAPIYVSNDAFNLKLNTNYQFPDSLSARVIIRGGDINNVYGGNDVSGKVYGGNAVGVYHSIRGDVYGGGNGSYAYTDKLELKDEEQYRDFYYDPATSSVDALNAFRPNAEQVSVYVKGTEGNPTVIGGAIYCGGNSATLASSERIHNPLVELKIGAFVTADNVYLGNNGASMITTNEQEKDDKGRVTKPAGVLRDLKEINSMDLTVKETFAKYMGGCAMPLMPRVVFDADYQNHPYTTNFGSFYCGGNVGSMTRDGLTTLNFAQSIIIYDKLVGGCNNANVAETEFNAIYEGGLIGNPDDSGNKLTLNFSGLRIQPKRWKDAAKTELVWNTVSAMTGENVDPITTGENLHSNDADLDRRLKGGNIYGGCYNSGHVNGNVVININQSLIDRTGDYAIFDQIEEKEGEALLYGSSSYNIAKRNTGVILNEQGMDVLGTALNVFGGGYGDDSEIWGSTTINLNSGYVFQVFGGGQKGAIGRGTRNVAGKLEYTDYDAQYSTTVNLNGSQAGVYRGYVDADDATKSDSPDMAEAEFIYGGGFFAPIMGDTHVNLNNGRIFNSFAGSCNADILGHAETIIGQEGFPWVRDHIYGANDMGGHIFNKGNKSFENEVAGVSGIYNPKGQDVPEVLKASAYVKYVQGRVDRIFGGCYGDWDYTDAHFSDFTYSAGESGIPDDKAAGMAREGSGFTKPRMESAFVYFKPNNNRSNSVSRVYGAGQGHTLDSDRDVMQHRSYVLINIPQTLTSFQTLEVFGAGDYSGVGMGIDAQKAKTNESGVEAAAVIDLVQGHIKDVFGASNNEGITRRTIVNVPKGSTIQLNRIFGGAYGLTNKKPCDVYESHVNYDSEDATLLGNIYGGNNNARRTLYGQVNISVPVWQNKASGYKGSIYGAGYGKDTWSQYTEVNLKSGADVYEVYGGGNNGKVLNQETLVAWKAQSDTIDLTIPGYEEDGLDNDLVTPSALGLRYNTNVHISQGATVSNYSYGAGYGADAVVSGTAYTELAGGKIVKDLYSAGTSGDVRALYGAKNFTASANAYVLGGSCRNVYGGGWKGSVGYHDTTKTTDEDDIPGETNVIIGKLGGTSFTDGVPAIERNAYAGGEGGAVFGKANLTLNSGYVGYRYFDDEPTDKTVAYYTATDGYYQEKLHDETWEDGIGLNRLEESGNVFGGGYDDNSSVDRSNVTICNGQVRGSVFGGGEIATIGRGKMDEGGAANATRTPQAIYKPGGTRVTMYNGHVHKNIFGGGKGYNLLGYGGGGKFYTDGYVFGQTEVYLHGGEVGTNEGVANGYGNVFGGGDIGYVYSGSYFTGTHTEETTSPNHYYYYDKDGNLTEDCKVVVSPYLQAKEAVTINGHAYAAGEWVTTDDLNTLPKKDKATSQWSGGWEKLETGTEDEDGNVIEERGVTIHNAVFAGGNVSSNSDRTYANAVTVFGNSTATLNDVYHRDFITVGTEHIGGLYGGGNLSVVGGYRELNITNYGTDYYGLEQRISIDEYRSLSNRERAYFKLEYECVTAFELDGVKYEVGDHLDEEKYLKLIDSYPDYKAYWQPYGFCSIYAGRLLNTIQRADYCAVYGSRMVLQGAKDRVANVAENIDYTINRVGELSLNRHLSLRDDDTGDDARHGNYFGIYSIVHYLGNLTSDVRFNDLYVDKDGNTDESVKDEKGNSQTFYTYKRANYDNNKRNIGTSYNEVALASSVFLELTTEQSEVLNKKVYGYVSGMVGLDLINMRQDNEGGGFVYARNEHHVPTYFPNKKNVVLSQYNHELIVGGKAIRNEGRSYKRYCYSKDEEPTDAAERDSVRTVGYGIDDDYALKPYQTSGNFIHKSKRIVDDCYPNNNAYDPESANYSDAHFWYVKGDVYIYGQKVSAYTGSATAYSRATELPLTITAASHGQLKLLNVKPNLYAYYAPKSDTGTEKVKIGSKDSNGQEIEQVYVNNDADSYGLNDVITWWDWQQLSALEKSYFVTETYVNCVTLTIDGDEYEPGTYVMDETDFTAFKKGEHKIVKADGTEVAMYDVADVIRSSNNLGHETGYVLTFDMNTPGVWDNYYTPTSGSVSGKKSTAEYRALESAQQFNYTEGPTFRLKNTDKSLVLGQRNYEEGEIIPQDVYDNNKTTGDDQAIVKRAYVATKKVNYTYGGKDKTVNVGTAIPESEYSALGTDEQASFAAAWVCSNTVKLDDENYLLYGELKTKDELDALKHDYPSLEADIDEAMSEAYICSKAGLYGGQQYEPNTNYSAIKSWCYLSEADRENFEFNYDAFDLISSTKFLNPHTDLSTTEAFHDPYSRVERVEYQAVFRGESKTLTLTDGSTKTFNDGDKILNNEYEALIRNDRRHYTRVDVGTADATVYIAKDNFIYGGMPYGRGQVVDADVYDNNPKAVSKVSLDDCRGKTVYYCYDEYTDGASKTVSIGTIKTEDEYKVLTNDQQHFVIQGSEPTETTTLYVSRQSDIYDLTKERVYTVVYQYTYYENNDDGSISLANELHVVNITIELESGAPQIGVLAPPPTVLPGNAVGLKAPEVSQGLYEILSSGWEIFANSDDADHHRNGEPFVNNDTPVYWYQNQKSYVAFYSNTYLGKTYSNAVPISVANYHDLARVMNDKEHHLYVDYDPKHLARHSKIYINDSLNVLDLFSDFVNLSYGHGPAGHSALNEDVKGGSNLDFFLHADIYYSKDNWKPIASGDGECFNGTLHGDGYTISGLDNSLFSDLCGHVYNLGVTGSFTSAGIADKGKGYVENSWVLSTATEMDGGVQAILGSPSATDWKQVVNCYYPTTNPYVASYAHAVSDTAFYNGSVAYNLNGFYLNRRYYDGIKQNDGEDRYYLKADADGLLARTQMWYPNTDASSGYNALNGSVGYVEDRYSDPDFIYANGTIPTSINERQRSLTKGTGDDEQTEVVYSPIWPDDYLFFGQMLTYGYGVQAHQPLPSHLMKNDGRLRNDFTSNRVHRAPAYFQSSVMKAAHFNPWAYLAAFSAPKTITDTDLLPAYQNMTAIDFAGHNDKDYLLGLNNGCFYQPLLDDDGLLGVTINGLTQNLLLYAPTAEANKQTNNVLTSAFADLAFSNYSENSSKYNDGNNYNRVAVANDHDVATVHGHLVPGNFEVTNDHLLVDGQDFNCPIPYKFADGYRMWYQRNPRYAKRNGTGWDAISLPFTVQLVTTQQKGELTHFYKGSTMGHEYWLRELTGLSKQDEETLLGAFDIPEAGNGILDYNNTFLWDYYYKQAEREDQNTDQYQEYYSSSALEKQYPVENYPFLTAGVPYLIGFPSGDYYEFDLSGDFKPLNTNASIATLDPQTVTFVSDTGVGIRKSDDEMKDHERVFGVDGKTYTFRPNYINRTLMAAAHAYALASDGGSYEAADNTRVTPFRPYFLSTASGGGAPRRVAFNGISSSMGTDKKSSVSGMSIYASKRNIVVTSGLRASTDVRIFNVSGVCVASFTIEPGQTIETPIHVAGIYAVHADCGHYTKKLLVGL